MKILESSGLKTPISCTFVKNDIDSFSDLCRHIAMPWWQVRGFSKKPNFHEAIKYAHFVHLREVIKK